MALFCASVAQIARLSSVIRTQMSDIYALLLDGDLSDDGSTDTDSDMQLALLTADEPPGECGEFLAETFGTEILAQIQVDLAKECVLRSLLAPSRGFAAVSAGVGAIAVLAAEVFAGSARKYVHSVKAMEGMPENEPNVAAAHLQARDGLPFSIRICLPTGFDLLHIRNATEHNRGRRFAAALQKLFGVPPPFTFNRTVVWWPDSHISFGAFHVAPAPAPHGPNRRRFSDWALIRRDESTKKQRWCRNTTDRGCVYLVGTLYLVGPVSFPLTSLLWDYERASVRGHVHMLPPVPLFEGGGMPCVPIATGVVARCMIAGTPIEFSLSDDCASAYAGSWRGFAKTIHSTPASWPAWEVSFENASAAARV